MQEAGRCIPVTTTEDFFICVIAYKVLSCFLYICLSLLKPTVLIILSK